jgi:hypothetical protein
LKLLAHAPLVSAIGGPGRNCEELVMANGRITNLHEFNNEVSEARIVAGFHWRFSTMVGKDMGWKIGAYTVLTCLKPLSVASN